MTGVATTPLDERRDDELVIRRFNVDPFDPWKLVSAIPRHKSYRVFGEPGGPLRIGMGAAARVATTPASGVSWGQLYDTLAASLGPLAKLATAFFSAAFDADTPFDEEWDGFVPVELCVPDIVWERDGDDYTMTVIGPESTFERLYRSGVAALTAAESRTLEAAPSIESIADNADGYGAAVQAALDRIELGAAEKIVVARPLDVTAHEPIPVPSLLDALATRFDNCFIFAFRPGGSHKGAAPTFLGATPERLVAVRDGLAQTGAIAGTAPRGVSARMDERHAQALLTSDKEMREHEVVGTMIVDALRPHCTSVERGELRFLKLPNVQHLWTPIEGRLAPGATIVDVAQSLHPTPAVGGQPRQAAVASIREIEPVRRGLYAGVVGTLDLAGGGELAVAIRSALVHDRSARVFAGAGIVRGSDPHREVEETRAKARAILDALEAT